MSAVAGLKGRQIPGGWQERTRRNQEGPEGIRRQSGGTRKTLGGTRRFQERTRRVSGDARRESTRRDEEVPGGTRKISGGIRRAPCRMRWHQERTRRDEMVPGAHQEGPGAHQEVTKREGARWDQVPGGCHSAQGVARRDHDSFYNKLMFFIMFRAAVLGITRFRFPKCCPSPWGPTIPPCPILGAYKKIDMISSLQRIIERIVLIYARE